MPDNPPISTTVPETVTTDLGVDKESVGNLNSDFADFWAEQDSKADLNKEVRDEPPQSEPPAAPSAPSQGAGQETHVEPAGELDIDKMELPPHSRPEHVEQFKKVKDLWKQDQRRAEEAIRKAAAAEAELAEARKNAWTPETRADYEHATQIRRRFDYISDPEFQGKFQQPVREQFHKILDEAASMLPNRQKAAEWAAEVKRDFTADHNSINRDWWMNSVVAMVPNELNRTALINQVSKLLDLQQERDAEITRRTSDRSSYDNWQTEKNTVAQQRMHQEIMAEIGEQEKRIKEVLPVDTAQAKTAEERLAMEAHNERFNRYNKSFIETMTDLSKNGPRAWVRAAVEATRTQVMNDQIINLEKEVKETKAERDRYKAELEKITGARRRIAHATAGTPPAGSEAAKKQLSNGSSIKDLSDPRKAMQSFFDEIDRNQI